MTRKKYYFNPNTLKYESPGKRFKEKVFAFLGHLSIVLVASIVLYLVFASFFNTPKEKGLIRENRQLRVQYQEMNKKLNLVENTLNDLKDRDENIYRMIFETEPMHASFRDAGFGGADRYSDLSDFNDYDLVLNTARRLDVLVKKTYVQSKSYDELIGFAREKEVMLSSIPAIMPISNRDLRRTASGYGWRIHPIYKIKKFHEGMDFTATRGTEVYATGDGVVSKVSSSRTGYGKRIEINHGFGYVTLYAHLESFEVKRGQKVKRGDVIGHVGSTGTSVAPHLHYEVMRNGEKVNPVNYYFNDLSPEEYDRMIEISMNSGQSFD